MDRHTVTFSEKYPSLQKLVSKVEMSGKDYVSVMKYDYSVESAIPNAGATSILGGRPSMEDYYRIEKIGDAEFYAVFDGHGGWQIAAMICEELPKRLTAAAIDYTDKESVEKEVHSIFLQLGKEIYQFRDMDRTGSTAVFAIRYKEYLYLFNVGDSTAIVFNDKNERIICTTDHKPASEKERISQHGSLVFGGRVDGGLAVARSFGDNFYNYYDENQYPKKPKEYAGFDVTVTFKPDIYSAIIPENEKWHMIMASDGLWSFCIVDESIPIEDCDLYRPSVYMDVVKSTPDAKLASQKLADIGLLNYQGDNITVIVVHF